MDEIDYRAFARDLMKLCAKHGVKISASDNSLVIIGPYRKGPPRPLISDYPYNELLATPDFVGLGDPGPNRIEIRRES